MKMTSNQKYSRKQTRFKIKFYIEIDTLQDIFWHFFLSPSLKLSIEYKND